MKTKQCNTCKSVLPTSVFINGDETCSNCIHIGREEAQIRRQLDSCERNMHENLKFLREHTDKDLDQIMEDLTASYILYELSPPKDSTGLTRHLGSGIMLEPQMSSFTFDSDKLLSQLTAHPHDGATFHSDGSITGGVITRDPNCSTMKMRYRR